MSYRIGNGYKGSSSLQTSVAEQEIIPSGYTFYKFNFVPDEDCTVIVNGEEIYWRAGCVWGTEPVDAPITSFKVKEAGKHFLWAGGY